MLHAESMEHYLNRKRAGGSILGTNNEYVLAMYDVRGKQDFIFKTNRVQEIIGGSEIIKNCFEDYLIPASKTVAEDGANGIYIYTENEKFSRESFENHMKEVRFSSAVRDTVNKAGRPVKIPYVTQVGDKGNKEGYVFVGEPISNKKSENIFEMGNRIEITSENLKKAIDGLRETISVYQNDSINRNYGKTEADHLGYYMAGKLLNGKEDAILPVWYKEEGGEIYLSMAAIGRKAYQNTLGDLVDKKYEPCQNRKDACPACRLFGMASKNESMGSKVRITDAFPTTDVNMKDEVTLRELGGPRISYLPFYAENGLMYDEYGAKIRGRKFYWHDTRATTESVYQDAKNTKSKRNNTVDLADNGSEFAFEVFFENITESEYKELLWVISLGQNSYDDDTEKFLCHKIGHGKPIGLGSCKIVVESVEKRTLEGGYKVSKASEISCEKPAGFNERTLEQFETAMNFHSVEGLNIAYPFVNGDEELAKNDENALANHQWFTSNNGRTKFDPHPNKLLPKVTDLAHMSMPTYDWSLEDGQNGGGYPNGGNRPNGGGNGQRESVRYVVGQAYPGKVTGYNPTGKFAFVSLDDGGKASFYDSDHDYDGMEVEVIYRGKKEGRDGKKRDNWDVK